LRSSVSFRVLARYPRENFLGLSPREGGVGTLVMAARLIGPRGRVESLVTMWPLGIYIGVAKGP